MDCPKGCGWIGDPKDYLEHLKTCPKIPGNVPRGEWSRLSPKHLKPLEENEPISEMGHLPPIVPHSQVCELLLQQSKIQAVYTLDDVKRFEAPTIRTPFLAYTKEDFEGHIRDAVTRIIVILELTRRLNCPNSNKIKHNARIILEINKKYLGLGYRLD